MRTGTSKKPSRYHRRADGLLETTRVDQRTKKRVHFYGHSDGDIDRQIMDYNGKQARGRSFGEVADEWSSFHFPTLAFNSLKCYKPAYARAVATFENTPIRLIKPQDVKAFLANFARGGRAKKTVATQKLILSLIFGFAVENGDLEYSPCDHVSIPKNLPKTHRNAAIPADEERVKKSAELWLLPYFVLYTGLRKGEALAIQGCDLDRKAWSITVSKSVYHMGDKPKIKPPKTEAGVRVIPILDPLKKLLPKKIAPSSYLFSDDGGKTPLTNRRYQTLWASFVTQTGVQCTAHQLRHSYATMLFECGVDVKDAQDLLGHSTEAMTRDTYTHVRNERKAETAAMINEKLKLKTQD